jgi:hypothetical protein
MQQRTCYRIFYGEHSDGRRIFPDLVKHLFECGATDKLYLFFIEIQMCRNVVKRPYQSLYGDSFHNALLLKIPLSLCCEAGLYFISSFSIPIYIRVYRFTFPAK